MYGDRSLPSTKMRDRTYPALPQSLGLMLEAVRQQLESDPGYLVDPACPYPEQLRDLLRRLVTRPEPGEPGMEDLIFRAGQTEGEQADSLIEEVQNAINSMKRLQRDIDASDDVGDRLAFLKNYGALMDRFLSLKEKANGIKQMYDFQRLVIGVMEQVLDKDGRLDFKERLKAANIAVD